MSIRVVRIIVNVLSTLSIITGIVIMEVCWEYWKLMVTFSTAGAIALLSGVLLFSAGLITLAVQLQSAKR